MDRNPAPPFFNSGTQTPPSTSINELFDPHQAETFDPAAATVPENFSDPTEPVIGRYSDNSATNVDNNCSYFAPMTAGENVLLDSSLNGFQDGFMAEVKEQREPRFSSSFASSTEGTLQAMLNQPPANTSSSTINQPAPQFFDSGTQTAPSTTINELFNPRQAGTFDPAAAMFPENFSDVTGRVIGRYPDNYAPNVNNLYELTNCSYFEPMTAANTITNVQHEYKNVYQDYASNILPVTSGQIPDDLGVGCPNLYENSANTELVNTESAVVVETPSGRGGETLPAAQDSGNLPERRRRRKTTPWTEYEHSCFLAGIEVFGKGSWKNISKFAVKTRSPTQVASHAQKFYHRHQLPTQTWKRRSIHDTSTVHPRIVAFVKAEADRNGSYRSNSVPQFQSPPQIMAPTPLQSIPGNSSDQISPMNLENLIYFNRLC